MTVDSYFKPSTDDEIRQSSTSDVKARQLSFDMDVRGRDATWEK